MEAGAGGAESCRDNSNIVTWLPSQIIFFKMRSWLPFLGNAKRTACFLIAFSRFGSCPIVLAKIKIKNNKQKRHEIQQISIALFFSFSGKCVFGFPKNSFSILHELILSYNLFFKYPQPRSQSLTTSLSISLNLVLKFSISYDLVLRFLPDFIPSSWTNPFLLWWDERH